MKRNVKGFLRQRFVPVVLVLGGVWMGSCWVGECAGAYQMEGMFTVGVPVEKTDKKVPVYAFRIGVYEGRRWTLTYGSTNGNQWVVHVDAAFDGKTLYTWMPQRRQAELFQGPVPYFSFADQVCRELWTALLIQTLAKGKGEWFENPVDSIWPRAMARFTVYKTYRSGEEGPPVAFVLESESNPHLHYQKVILDTVGRTVLSDRWSVPKRFQLSSFTPRELVEKVEVARRRLFGVITNAVVLQEEFPGPPALPVGVRISVSDMRYGNGDYPVQISMVGHWPRVSEVKQTEAYRHWAEIQARVSGGDWGPVAVLAVLAVLIPVVGIRLIRNVGRS